MNRYRLGRLLAICLALALVLSMPGVADEVVEINADDALLVEVAQSPDEAPEAGVAEATGLLGELEPSADESPAPERAEATPAPETGGETVHNAVPEGITLGVQMKYALDGSSLAPGRKITYKTGKASVATVSKKGVVTAKKKGRATISCYRGKTLLATCIVTVVPAPSKVSLGMSSIRIGKTESVQLVPKIKAGTMATFTWSSGKPSVVSVSKEGVITGNKLGTATVTVRTQTGKKASLTVTVAKTPSRVKLDRQTASLTVGKTLKLEAEIPSKAASHTITWTSSDDGVATVSDSGKVTAVAEGQADITVSTFNGKVATCAVTVVSAATPPPYIEDDSVSYRALLIGEEDFSPVCVRNRSDVLLMEKMLRNILGLYGGAYSIVKEYDLDSDGVLAAISSTYADADENDVSLFFIATHGDVIYSGDDAGALAMSPGDTLPLGVLANALAAVPGKVIVILESCGSGAGVYANSSAGAQRNAALDAAKDFDQAVVKAFSRVDTGLVVEVQPYGLRSNGVRSNTGELRLENKFYVLTASGYQEESWGMETGNVSTSYNYFTKWLTEGIGTSGRMPADTNKNGRTTLHELYTYIANQGIIYSGGRYYYQHVQVYPSNSSYVLFVR